MSEPIETTEQPDLLDISDEDFLKMETPVVEAVEPVVEEGHEDEKEAVQDHDEDPKTEPKEKEVVDEKADPVDVTEAKTIVEGVIDYEAEYKKLMGPFKANGQEMTAKNADDAITLMQMGANYHKKMAGMKSSLKTLKLLEKNNLLDPDKLNYLIDLNNKNPEAITKLLKDSGIDPLDVNVKDESTYTPTPRSVSDTEMDLDQVLESIQETPTYSRTLNVLTKEWDETSKNAVANTPHIISVINGHIADGTYDTVMKAVNYERSLGKLQGVSDLEAYKSTGDVLYAAGKLGTPAAATVVKPVVDPSVASEEAKRRERKKAASPTKTTATTTAAPFNPLDLSDEEFAKFDPKRFIKR